MKGELRGRIVIAQEDRIRVVDDEGRGFLFVVGRWRATLGQLARWRDDGTVVRVRYRGVPDAGATVTRIEPET